MYKVKYYLSSQSMKSKTFKTLHEAIMFSIYEVGYGDMYGIDKVEE